DLRFLFLIFCFHGNDGLELPETSKKKPKPNGLDSRLLGNDEFRDYSVSRRMGNGGNYVKNAV
ncbi:TPA: hypothetical protein ACLA5Q_001872, partial [Neisseria meningitidis]